MWPPATRTLLPGRRLCYNLPMYTPMNLLANYVNISKRRQKFQDRWTTPSGQQLFTQVEGAIKNGGGERLNEVVSGAPPGFLEDASDLRGLRLVKQTIAAADGQELFKNLTLNYARWRDVVFGRGTWRTVTGNFIDALRVDFDSVTLVRFNSYGAHFEDCKFTDCNFLERNTFSNCSFKNVEFKNCFFETDVFVDCKFDELTKVVQRAGRCHTFGREGASAAIFDRQYEAPFHRSLREAYEAGRISHLARTNLFREKCSLTRYNTPNRSQRLARYFLEYTTGYGIKPIRVLVSALTLLLTFTAIFVSAFGEVGFLLSVGGFFTFGANTGYLEKAAFIYQFLYGFEAFLGVVTMSTFIVVMTNYWASLR
jgi:uncharacterized protein YjbI with pentapeptide repeats